LLGKDDDAAHRLPRNPMEGDGDEVAAGGHGGAPERGSRHLRGAVTSRECSGFDLEDATIRVKRSRGGEEIASGLRND
jgi:hypothetical protein